MDRRDQPERTGIVNSDLKKALDVIIQSYRGIPPERLFHDAISCFDALIDISLGADSIREFAQQQAIDLKYLVDGANFVISKMHFNTENNFYITLGLSRNASTEEIRQRWKRLMMLYHPDRHQGEEGWVEERAKKVNEAYNTLKDETKRSAYDRQQNSQNNNHAGFSHRETPSSMSVRSRQQHQRHHPPRTRQNPTWLSFRRYIPKVLISIYVLAALIALVIIYFQNRTESLETALTRQSRIDSHAETAPALAVATQQGTTPAITPPEELPDTQNRQYPSTASPEEPAPRQGTSKSLYRRILDISTPSQPRVSAKEPAAPQSAPAIQRQPEEIPAPSVPVSPPTVRSAELAPAAEKSEPSTAAQVALTQNEKESVARAEQPVLASREEIETFMQQYLTAYRRCDLNAFMALFSKSAVENNSMTYPEIRNAYRETFSEKINHYRIDNMNVRIERDFAYVNGVYQINRYSSKDDRLTRYSGKILWKLGKEHGSLKILSLNYDK